MKVLTINEKKESMERTMKLCEKTQPLITRINGAYLLGKMTRYFDDN